MAPAFMLFSSAPIACAQSSTRISPCLLAISVSSELLAIRPYRCTVSIALVLLVMAFSVFLLSRQWVDGSGSTNTGFRPHWLTARMEAIYVLDGTMTSSPGFN